MDKLLPGNETILLIPAIEVNGVPHFAGDTLIPFDAPTVALINKYLVISTPADLDAGAGGNISCALRDDSNVALTDSDTDSDRTICSVGQSEDLTFYNFDAEFNIFRDELITSPDSQFNLARDLTRAPDVPYIVAHRIGEASDTLAVADEEWDFYYAWTDNPVPGYSDGGNQLVTQTVVPKNTVHISARLGA